MKTTDLYSVQRKFRGMWVAFTDNLADIIVASKDAKVAYKKA